MFFRVCVTETFRFVRRCEMTRAGVGVKGLLGDAFRACQEKEYSTGTCYISRPFTDTRLGRLLLFKLVYV